MTVHGRDPKVLVQIGKPVEKFHTVTDTLSIGQDSIPDSGSSGILEADLREIELTVQVLRGPDLRRIRQ